MTPNKPKNSQKRPYHDQPNHQMTQPATMAHGAKNSQKNDHAPTVVQPSTLAAGVAVNTVATNANRQPTESVTTSDDVTLTYKRNKASGWYDRDGRARDCDYCGNEYLAKRSSSRFCSSRCRRLQWDIDNPDQAAVYAAQSKASLKRHIIERGGVWIDQD